MTGQLHICSALVLLAQLLLPTTAAADSCTAGYVWRAAYSGDQVCVLPDVAAQAASDNAEAAARVEPDGGFYGPDTCQADWVWREATPDDHVCTTVDVRTQTALDNSQASARTLPDQPAATLTAGKTTVWYWPQQTGAPDSDPVSESDTRKVRAGDAVNVSNDGLGTLNFGDALQVSIFRDSKLNLSNRAEVDPKAAPALAYHLLAGTTYNTVTPEALAGKRVQVATDRALITATGTKFLVYQQPLSGSTVVLVTKGATTVATDGPAAATVTVAAGMVTSVAPNQPPAPPQPASPAVLAALLPPMDELTGGALPMAQLLADMSAGAVTLTASPADASWARPVTVTWTNLPANLQDAWIGFYRPGANDLSEDKQWIGICEGTLIRGSGSCTVTIDPNEFSVAMQGNRADFEFRITNSLVKPIKLATSGKVTLTKNGPPIVPVKTTLTTDASTVSQAQNVKVAWTDIPDPVKTAWIGVYRVGADDQTKVTYWYVSCETIAIGPRGSGECSFNLSPKDFLLAMPSVSSAQFEFRLFSDINNKTRLATSSSFTVRKP